MFYTMYAVRFCQNDVSSRSSVEMMTLPSRWSSLLSDGYLVSHGLCPVRSTFCQDDVLHSTDSGVMLG